MASEIYFREKVDVVRPFGTAFLSDHEIAMLKFRLHTLWLFTRSDLKTVIIPTIIFAMCGAFSGKFVTSQEKVTISGVLSRLPLVTMWTWLHLLILDISNQRKTSSITEDKMNKPWRPLPAGRLTQDHARKLLLVVVLAAVTISWHLEALRESTALIILNWIYNDLEGAKEDPILRNVLNACGLVSFNAGATAIAADLGRTSFTQNAHTWFAIITSVIFSTIHVQDLADTIGDAAIGRRTIPLVYGDGPARWSAAVLITAWSFLCPWYWGVTIVNYIMPVVVGGTIALQVLLKRDIRSDALSWKLWCIWSMTLYFLPLCRGSA